MHRCSASTTTPTPRAQLLLQPADDLAGEPFLGLEVAGEQLDHPGQLGQAQDALARQVADVGDTPERQQVVLAQRAQWDRPGHHQLVVALVVGEGGGAERRRGEQLGEGVRDPARGAGKALGAQVGPEGLQQRPGGRLGRLQVDPAEGPGDPEVPVGDDGHRSCRLAAAVGRTPAAGKASASRARARAPSDSPKSRRAMSK
jgi:hypothetical protein